MKPKRFLAGLFAFASFFVTCSGFKKAENSRQSGDDDIRESVLSRMGYSYNKEEDYEEIDTGKIISRKEKDGRKERTVIRKKASPAKQARRDSAPLLESTVIYEEDGKHISSIESARQRISFRYDKDRNLTYAYLNGNRRIDSNSGGYNETLIRFSNGTETRQAGSDEGRIYSVDDKARQGIIKTDGNGNTLEEKDLKTGKTASYAYDEYGSLVSRETDSRKYSLDNGVRVEETFGRTSALTYEEKNIDTRETLLSVTSPKATDQYTLKDNGPIEETQVNGLRIALRDDSQFEEKKKALFISPFGDREYYNSDDGKLRAVIDQEGVREYGYDERGRLSLVRHPDGKEEIYGYDEGSNIVSVIKADGYEELRYEEPNDPNRLTSFSGRELSYDGYGCLLDDGTFSYSWEAGSFLTERKGENSRLFFEYGTDGRRNLKYSEKEGATEYIYKESNLIASRSDRKGAAHYIYKDNGDLLAINFQGDLFYYVHNPRGVIEGLVDKNGTPVVKYSYSSFGVPEIEYTAYKELSDANEILYKDYVYDSETGLYYLNSRYYSPFLMRFISLDDLSRISQRGLNDPFYNLYAYALNDPISLSDSTGCMAIAASTYAILQIVAGIALIVLPLFLAIATINYNKKNAPLSLVNTGVFDRVKWDLKNFIEEAKKVLLVVMASFRITSLQFWKKRERPKECHHIIAQKAPRAEPARIIWIDKCGYTINDKSNLVQLKYGFHKHLHTASYYDWVNILVSIGWACGGKDGTKSSVKLMNEALEALNKNWAPF